MDLFYADLHIHSRYSRATSKKLTIRKLAAWGGVKGLKIIGTGDFTHPGWMEEIERELEQEESGLLKLKDSSGLDQEVPWIEGSNIPVEPKFILCTEISSIYKKGGQVRKIHNLVLTPSLDKAKELNQRLGQMGNLQSDGRPILGLDSQDLLEMVLELDPLAFLIPAHIWTPWFSLFGSKSGFNTMEECFGPLAKHIFALETGLSSDPEMNWLWSDLDKYTLVSNSDAHSGEKLAREANIFSGEPSFETIYRALQGIGVGQKFLGTVEFFPEEGKYHLDGHRKCGVVLDPRETREHGNKCPVCGKNLTVGVLNRIFSLADREQPAQPSNTPGYASLIPLNEVISEILGKGPQTKTVYNLQKRLINSLGSELNILQNAPLEEIRSFSSPLAEGILRMRNRQVYRDPGFDGQFGTISVFTPQEKKEFQQGKSLFADDNKIPSSSGKLVDFSDMPPKTETGQPKEQQTQQKPSYNPEQLQAIKSGSEPTLVIAGPGTGKTRTLLGRVEYLLEQGAQPRHVLVVTFTRAAAREIGERLLETFGQQQCLPRTDTLHAIAYENWLNIHTEPPVILSDEEGFNLFAEANPETTKKELLSAWDKLNLARERQYIPEELQEYWNNFYQLKEHLNLVDFADLLDSWLCRLQTDAGSLPYTHVLVDEVQDLSRLQTSILHHLLPSNGHGLFAIGDPAQSIYGFRGAIKDIEKQLQEYWPELSTISLDKNYRNKQDIVRFSSSIFPEMPLLESMQEGKGNLTFYQAQSGEQEAVWIGQQIKSLLGGTGHLQADLEDKDTLSPGEIAVLVRFKALIPPLERNLTKMGLPCFVPQNTPFWQDHRIELILNTAAKFLGINPDDSKETLDCPEKVIIEGPQAISIYFQDIYPFDQLFWKSQPFRELKKSFKEHGGWSNLLSWIRLESELDRVREKAQKIRIITLHAAKGLEFDTVFLPALEQGILPYAGKEFLSGRAGGENKPDEEEEKRLFYVGLTRAKNNLILSRSPSRKIYGRNFHLNKSPFLDLLPWDGVNKIRSVVQKVQKEKQLGLLS